MPEGNVETSVQEGPVLERAPQSLLHIAIFDLGRQSFASMSHTYNSPTLFIDNDPSIEGKLTAPKRIETLSRRHTMYNLPPLKNIGRINTGDNPVLAHAVTPVYQEKANILRNLAAFRRYHLDGLHAHVLSINEGNEGTIHTEILDAAFRTIPDLSRYRAD